MTCLWDGKNLLCLKINNLHYLKKKKLGLSVKCIVTRQKNNIQMVLEIRDSHSTAMLQAYDDLEYDAFL